MPLSTGLISSAVSVLLANPAVVLSFEKKLENPDLGGPCSFDFVDSLAAVSDARISSSSPSRSL